MDFERALDAWASRQHPALADDLPRLTRHRHADLLERIAEQGSDPAWATRYASSCPVHGVGPEAYRLREVDLGPDGWVLAGIHFYGLEVGRPFVGVVAMEQTPADGDQVRRMHTGLMAAFSSFGVGVSRWASGTLWSASTF